MKIAGMVTLYNPDNSVKQNIESYLLEIDKLYVVDNTPDKENIHLLPNSSKIEYLPQYDNIGVASALYMVTYNGSR